MDWKETVMTTKQAKAIILAKHCSPETTESDIVVTEIEQDLIEAQAEISFKAGAKEVVDWVNAGSYLEKYEGPAYRVFLDETWQAFLKRKGLK